MLKPASRLFLVLFLFITVFPVFAQDQSGTRVIVLGTGTPVPDHRRAGAGVAVIHKGQAYLFDAGAGVVIRAIEAWRRMKIEELNPGSICCLFFTHLHSDHIHDYSELASARWWERDFKLRAWGPKGLAELTEGLHKMAGVEARIRARGTPAEAMKHLDYYQVDVTEIEDGVVFQKDDLTIEAFTVPHGEIKPAFGYKITTDDRSIVISGDTSYSEKLIEKAKGVDILIHEVISASELAKMPAFWQHYHGTSHTPTDKLAELANKAKPGLLVLYHILFMNASEEDLLNEVRSGYKGKVVLANDLDMF